MPVGDQIARFDPLIVHPRVVTVVGRFSPKYCIHCSPVGSTVLLYVSYLRPLFWVLTL